MVFIAFICSPLKMSRTLLTFDTCSTYHFAFSFYLAVQDSGVSSCIFAIFYLLGLSFSETSSGVRLQASDPAPPCQSHWWPVSTEAPKGRYRCHIELSEGSQREPSFKQATEILVRWLVPIRRQCSLWRQLSDMIQGYSLLWFPGMTPWPSRSLWLPSTAK